MGGGLAARQRSAAGTPSADFRSSPATVRFRRCRIAARCGVPARCSVSAAGAAARGVRCTADPTMSTTSGSRLRGLGHRAVATWLDLVAAAHGRHAVARVIVPAVIGPARRQRTAATDDHRRQVTWTREPDIAFDDGPGRIAPVDGNWNAGTARHHEHRSGVRRLHGRRGRHDSKARRKDCNMKRRRNST